MQEKEFIADPEQQQVIDFVDGDALVLAPPGCGKTDVLTHRIIKAHKNYGIPYSDMLCLTFTNRASREMQNRVRQRINEPTTGLFVGNLHRFCIRFLTENDLIKLDTSIIDEDDQTEIIANLAELYTLNYRSQSLIKHIISNANEVSKMSLGFPPELVRFRHINVPKANADEQRLTQRYIDYKRSNNLIDYDDIINLAYKAMISDGFKSLKNSNYRWVQVDEVQDLNPLQHAIINRLIDPDRHTLVFLGDERQSIFSFIGASLDNLQSLKKNLRIFNFNTNYRSPKFLVDFINKYAETNLGVEKDELPTACADYPNKGGLVLLETNDRSGYEQMALIAAQTRQLALSGQDESIGILARTNARIEGIAQLLEEHHIRFLKLSNRDRFKMVDYKTIYSHLAVVANEHRNAEWCRILYQTKVVNKISDAHTLVSRLKKIGLSLTDMLRGDGSSYLLELYNSLNNDTIVVFDTETTGLNVFEDDVIQISALKINSNDTTEASVFNVVISTDKDTPEKLDDGTYNPMAKIYADAEKIDFSDAIKAFIDFIGDCTLIGHNSEFDINIILNNIRRRTISQDVDSQCFHRYYDTLKAARLVDPDLKSHELAQLIRLYNLKGSNSHYALDDVKATVSLIMHLYTKMQPLIDEQSVALRSAELRKLSHRLRNRYGSYYAHTRDKLYSPEISTDNSLIAEIQWLYENFVADKYIKPIPQFDYITDLFRKVMIDPDEEPYFLQQLTAHVHEMRTFNESDLYHNGVVKEKIHLMTIHKAKGLQFDNVFVYNLNDIPFSSDYFSDEGIEEAKRLLYVAISRAKRRLFLCYEHGYQKFINKELQKMCIKLTPEQISRILQLENVFKDIEDI